MLATRGMLLFSVAVLLALAGTACTKTSSCSRDPDSLFVPLAGGGSVVDGGGTVEDGGSAVQGGGSMVEGNTYHSAPYGGPYTDFPPFRTITFEHGLAAIPYAVQFWLAFLPYSTLAPSAGNMTELREVGDSGVPALNDKTISVYNNTCSEFYLWVVAERSSP